MITRETVSGMFESAATEVVAVLPAIGMAVLLLLTGYVVARLLEFLLKRFFSRLRVEALLERAGAVSLLQRMGWSHPACRLFERTAFYLVLFLFLQQASSALGFTPLSELVATLVRFAPRVIAALAIVLAGSLLAGLFGRMTEAGARSVGAEFASILGKLVSGATVAVAFLMAFAQLRIDSILPQGMVLGAFLGLVLALALTFGLGSRELSRNILAGAYARRVFEPGCEIEIGGVKGVLLAITPLQTLIQKGDRVVALPNSVYLDEKIVS